MQRITILLRYGLACTTIAITAGVAFGDCQEDEASSLPPIVRVAEETTPSTSDAMYESDNDDLVPVVQAAHDPTQEPPITHAHPFHEGFQEIPAIVSAGEVPTKQKKGEPAQAFHPELSFLPLHMRANPGSMALIPSRLRPMSENAAPIQPASGEPSPAELFSQVIESEIPDDQLPPIFRPSDLNSLPQPPTWQGEQSAIRPAETDLMTVPASPANDAPIHVAENTPVPVEEFPTQDAVPVPDPIPTTNSAIQDSPVVIQGPVQAVPMTEGQVVVPGALESGFNVRGQCAFCGGVGCDQCSGTAPVMDYTSEVVPETTEYLAQEYDCCGFMMGTQHYCVVDALYYTRNGGLVFGGNFSGFNDFEWTMGGRVTLGYRFDVTSGFEASYMGFDPWLAVTEQFDAGGGLFGNLGAVGGFNPANLSAFDNATYLEQFQRSDLHSSEISQTYWGWDVVKTSLGVRFLSFDDFFRLSSANTVGEQGFYTLDLENTMIGMQSGMELFYDIGYRLSFSMVSKIAVYANRYEGQTTIVNDGVTVLNNSDEETDFGASAEFGLHGHYQILPRVRARFGYDLLGLWEVATTSQNFNPAVSPGTGTLYFNDDDAIFHGVFVGVEFYR